MTLDAQTVARALGLVPHPEGGYFRETYRSGAAPMASQGRTDVSGTLLATDRAGGERNLMTSIYWLLDRAASVGYWCQNRSDHGHYFQLGSAITYYVIHPDGRFEEARLGPRPDQGDLLQLFVPGGCWKAASLRAGEFALIGEAVAPGFDFRDFSYGDEATLVAAFPELFAERSDLKALFKPDKRRDFEAYYPK